MFRNNTRNKTLPFFLLISFYYFLIKIREIKASFLSRQHACKLSFIFHHLLFFIVFSLSTVGALKFYKKGGEVLCVCMCVYVCILCIWDRKLFSRCRWLWHKIFFAHTCVVWLLWVVQKKSLGVNDWRIEKWFQNLFKDHNILTCTWEFLYYEHRDGRILLIMKSLASRRKRQMT